MFARVQTIPSAESFEAQEDLVARRTKSKTKPQPAGKEPGSSSKPQQAAKASEEDEHPGPPENQTVAELMQDLPIAGEGFESKVQFKKQSKRNSIVVLYYKADQGKWEQKVQIVCKDERFPVWIAMLLVKRIQSELTKGTTDLLHVKTRREELLATYDSGELLNLVHQWRAAAGPESMYDDIIALLRDEAETLPVKQNDTAKLRRSDHHIPAARHEDYAKAAPEEPNQSAPPPIPSTPIGNPDTAETQLE